MEEKFDEMVAVYRDWNRKWKDNQLLRHENWELNRRDNCSFEENLSRRIQWEKELKKREWTKYRLKIEKKLVYNMTQEEIVLLRKYIIKMNRINGNKYKLREMSDERINE
jgi:hypothetical protein